uniref:Uncharacterized protein n=1 Tax=Aphis glycines virus 3 isolate 2 TaxID=2961859 RepID=A0A976RXB3_9VIRU|nr:hypothetical protein 3 [Aphis glycines virus 3 isolate 2]
MNTRPIKSMQFVRSPRPDPNLYKAIDDIRRNVVNNTRVNRNKSKPVNKSKNQTKAKSVNKTKSSKIDGFVSRAVAQLQATLSNPLVAMLISVVIFSVYTHHYNYDASIVKSLVETLNSTQSTQPLATWINTNVSKFFAIAATVAASMSLPSDVMYSSMLLGTVTILMMPTASISLYFIIVAIITLYVKLKAKSDKFVVIIIAVMAMIYYNLTPVHKVDVKTATKP